MVGEGSGRTEATSRSRRATEESRALDPSYRLRWLGWHATATGTLVAVVWWAFHWQLSALQWWGLLLTAIVCWHALQGRGPMSRANRWVAGGAVLAATLATLPLDQPWKAPWWPGSPLAGAAPDPCAQAAPAAGTGDGGQPGDVTALVPEADDPRPGGYSDLAIEWRSCGWQDSGRQLYLEYRHYPWQGTGDDATADAGEVFSERRDHAAGPDPVDIGEEAYADRGEDGDRLTIEARKANVVITVRYYRLADAEPLSSEEHSAVAEFSTAATEAVDTD